MKYFKVIAVIVIIVAAAVLLRQISNRDEKSYGKPDMILVEDLKPGQTIQSPFTVKGKARGYWFFEASFPVKLIDANGNLVASGIAEAKSDWMTQEFVPFSVVLEFFAPATEKGTLILEKDNPSGLSENADELHIPIVFN